ncbi:MAG: YitT family protein [Bacilli bacterium]|nr:YitT family protein [Bacilli bacterium]
MNKQSKKRKIKDFISLNIGVILSSIGFVFVMNPNNAVYGGVQGISIIFSGLFPNFERASYVLLALNIFFLILAWLFVSKEFFLKTIYCSIAGFVYAWLMEFGLTTEVVKTSIEIFNSNGFLVVFFSAVLMGAGLGLALKAGASTGGIDILQAICYKYLKIPYGKSLIFIDGTIVLIGSLLLHNDTGTAFIENILYALVMILVSGFVMDSIVFSGFNVRSMYIITKNPDEVKKYVLEKLSRGVTEINAVGGYTGETRRMLVCVLSSREYYVLKDIIQNIDPSAFIYATRASEVHGEGFSYDSFEE